MGSSSAAKQSAKLQAQIASESLALQKMQLSQPKQITTDNFMANKLKSLKTLRLGIASTINPQTVSALNTKLGV